MYILDLPPEIITEILRELDLSEITLSCKVLHDLCNELMYSRLEIKEDYRRSPRFIRTYKLLWTLSHSYKLPLYVRVLCIEWSYPEKIDMGYDKMAILLKRSLSFMRHLHTLKLRIRLRNKSFKECFLPKCPFTLSTFDCNFGTDKDKRIFEKEHVISVF